MNPTRVAWVAGILDGEGSVGIYLHPSGKTNAARLVIEITNTHLDALRLIRRLFGGYIHPLSRPIQNRPIWVWTAAASTRKAFLEAVLPYCVIKRDQVTLALQLLAFKEGAREGRAPTAPYSPIEIGIQRGFCAISQLMKHPPQKEKVEK